MLLRGGERPWDIIVDINGLVRCRRSSSSVREVSVVTGMYLPPKADDRKGRRHVCSLLNTYCPFHVISINSPSLPPLCNIRNSSPCASDTLLFVLPFRVSILPRVKTASSYVSHWCSRSFFLYAPHPQTTHRSEQTRQLGVPDS